MGLKRVIVKNNVVPMSNCIVMFTELMFKLFVADLTGHCMMCCDWDLHTEQVADIQL